MDNLRKRHLIVVNRCCLCKLNGSPLIIFSSIVRSPVPYGMPSSVTLVCLGLCLIAWRICLPVSGRVVALEVLYSSSLPYV
jgi:hypothetical protein